MLQLIQPCCNFHLLPILVYRQRHLSRGHFRGQNLFRGFVPAKNNCTIEGTQPRTVVASKGSLISDGLEFFMTLAVLMQPIDMIDRELLQPQ